MSGSPKPTYPIELWDAPFLAETTYENDLVESLKIPPKGLYNVEKKHGILILNVQIGKYLHAEKW